MQKYVAFISYRHKELDASVASKLHSLIERYPVPKSIAKSRCSNRIGIVFRDKEELPLSSDLSKSIMDALDNSEYLIVVCTPDTPGSHWVQKEIEYFLEKHSYDKILIVLAAGEPENSFPAPLIRLSASTDNPEAASYLQGKIEPLAADVRSESVKQSLRRLKRETTRIAAALLGCPYDDLQQRFRRRKIRRIATALSVLILSVVGYTSTVLVKNDEISRVNADLLKSYEQIQQVNNELNKTVTDMQIVQSLFLSEKSAQLLEQGNRTAAIHVALAALPVDNARPLVSEAEFALSNALYAYNSDAGTYVASRSFSKKGGVDIEKGVQTKDGQTYAYYDSNAKVVNVVNTIDGKELWSRSPQDILGNRTYDSDNDLIRSIFINEKANGLVIVHDRGVICADITNGTALWDMSFEKILGTNTFSLNSSDVAADKDASTLYITIRYWLRSNDEEKELIQMVVLDVTKKGESVLISLEEMRNRFYLYSFDKPIVSDDGRYYLQSYKDLSNNQFKKLVQIDCVNGSISVIENHKFEHALYSYAPKSNDILLCYIDQGIEGNETSSTSPALIVCRLNNQNGFPTIWEMDTKRASHQFDYSDYDVLAGRGIYYYSDNNKGEILTIVLNKRINRYRLDDGRLLSSRDFVNGIQGVVQAYQRNVLFLFMADGSIDPLELSNNRLGSEHSLLIKVNKLDFTPTNNIIANNNVIVAENFYDNYYVVYRILLDPHALRLASFDNYVNSESFLHIPEKQILAIYEYDNDSVTFISIKKSRVIAQVKMTSSPFKGMQLGSDGNLWIRQMSGISKINLTSFELIPFLTNVDSNSIIPVLNRKGKDYFLTYEWKRGSKVKFELNSIGENNASVSNFEVENVYAFSDALVSNDNYMVFPIELNGRKQLDTLAVVDFTGAYRYLKLLTISDDLIFSDYSFSESTKISAHKPYFGTIDSEGQLHLVNLESGELMLKGSEYLADVIDFSFINNEEHLVITQSTGDVVFLDLETGRAMATVALSSFSRYSSRIECIDDNAGICIIGGGYGEAYVFSTSDYSVKQSVPRYSCYLPDQRAVLCLDSSYNLVKYPLYTIEELISWGIREVENQGLNEADARKYYIW